VGKLEGARISSTRLFILFAQKEVPHPTSLRAGFSGMTNKMSKDNGNGMRDDDV
jgi:hypothetical protein